MIGRELGGRYEILTRIGNGGMALVYKALDVLLGRHVAVKVLRSQYVHDEEFIQRFRREAQAAASLSHPNVVSIYDVGQEEDIHYIVMEYVDGHNLNEVIQEKAPLQTEEAVRIATQICDALEHAHQNHIIHRDIKPHNILIGKNGRVKVTDFGIARAITQSSITTTGSVIGSVHYFSPEHAKGVSTGEKSDLYSLGIVLYQMLTGTLPFLSESPVGVALMHLQETFKEPREINSHIPQSVENVILKSMRKKPAERYHSASEMLADLETSLNPERQMELKIDFGKEDMEETKVMPAIRGDHQFESPRPTAGSASVNTADENAGSASLKETPANRRWIRPVVTVSITLLIILLVFIGFRYVQSKLDVPEVDVPYVVGMTEADARKALEDTGLKVEEPSLHENRADVDKDVVYAQSKSNMRVKKGAFVRLSISDGPELKLAGNYVGGTYEDAVAALKLLGVADDRIEKIEEFNDAAADTVLAQSIAANTEFDPASVDKVTLTVSKGLDTVKMPNLVGKTESEARRAIIQAGLVLGEANIVRDESYKPVGVVIEQFPYDANQPVAKGSEVSITVSSGLPKTAFVYNFNIQISPAQAGQSSEVRIVYTDATGDNIEWGKRKINNTKIFNVKAVLGPNTEATVNVFRDGKLVDTFTQTYDDAQNGVDSSLIIVPGDDPFPPPTGQTDPGIQDPNEDDGNGSSNGSNLGQGDQGHG